MGRYRLIRGLSGVAVGEAYLAKLVAMQGFEKQVVLWRVGETPTHGSEWIEAIMREAKQAASLSHANVAQVLDLGVADGMWFVATEYVRGRTLDTVLRLATQLPWQVAVHIAREAAIALSYAHGQRTPSGELVRLVHGRLCARRITISSAGDVKVTGFGTSSAWTRCGEQLSPEEVRREPLDGRADVFALAAILRSCLPRAGVPEALRHLIEHAMQAYPEWRPTAAELQKELTRILHAAERPVAPRELAALAVAPIRPIAARPTRFVTDTIERIERALDSMTFEPSTDMQSMLCLYERLGRLCVAAHVGERALMHMTRALDLADVLGRDDYAARFCALRAELLAQASRTDESHDWLERAAVFRS